MITLQHYLILSIILFIIGAIGVVVRRNMLIILMSIELMVGGACLALLAFSRWNLLPDGKALLVLVIALAAAQLVAGLSIVVAVFRRSGSISVDRLSFLRG